VGAIGSYALMGMFVGAVSVGALTDRWGRRRMFLACLSLYSVAMLLVALAPNPTALGITRFIAGLGFGGIAPVAIALVVEVARPGQRNRLNAIMLAGFPVGGVLAAVTALLLLEPVGFRALWGFGAIALVTVVPLAWKYIPETSVQAQQAAASGGVRALLPGRELFTLAMFSLANFMGFLLVFGLNTWLPTLLNEAGYSLGSALTFQLLFNLGAVAGGYAGSAIADRFGSKLVAACAFAVAAVAIAGMAATPPSAAMLLITVAAGAGSIGTQIVVFGYVATHYPTLVRATALGVTTGIGRLGAVCGPLIGGFLLSLGASFGWTFAVFAAMALVGALACGLVRSRTGVESEVGLPAVSTQAPARASAS
jgi:AAHS family benzoate transporter-like MFS transporter